MGSSKKLVKDDVSVQAIYTAESRSDLNIHKLHSYDNIISDTIPLQHNNSSLQIIMQHNFQTPTVFLNKLKSILYHINNGFYSTFCNENVEH